MTLIELGIVIGIASVLLAMVLGLARHVDAAVKIRRAQADLAEWHETLNRWHLQFGEYPYARVDTDPDNRTPITPLDTVNWNFTDPEHYPLTVLTNSIDNLTVGHGCYVRFYTTAHPGGTNITFRSFLTTAIPTVDPWGTPYIYIPSDNAKTYTLFSCGPNRQTTIDGRTIPTSSSPTPNSFDSTLDDIYLER